MFLSSLSLSLLFSSSFICSLHLCLLLFSASPGLSRRIFAALSCAFEATWHVRHVNKEPSSREHTSSCVSVSLTCELGVIQQGHSDRHFVLRDREQWSMMLLKSRTCSCPPLNTISAHSQHKHKAAIKQRNNINWFKCQSIQTNYRTDEQNSTWLIIF